MDWAALLTTISTTMTIVCAATLSNDQRRVNTGPELLSAIADLLYCAH